MKKNQKNFQAAPADIDSLIVEVRGQKVILDADLARIYGVKTRALNQAVKRNLDRFPTDFLFRLAESEKNEVITNCDHLSKLKFAKALPLAFTEHGAIMAANVLKSARAVQMSVFVVRAFVKMRSALNETRELSRRLALLEQELKIRLNIHEAAIVDILQRIMNIIDPPPSPPAPPPPEIGFHAKEDSVPYRIKRRFVRS
jgi:ORF6N domain.